MKNNVFAFPLLALAFVALFVTSCKKDEPVVEEKEEVTLMGVWEVSSFTIDDYEMVGTWSKKLTYDFQNASEGEMKTTITQMDDSVDIENGTFIFNETDSVLSITMDGYTIDYDYTMTNSVMTLTAVDDGETLVIIASK